MSKKQNLGQFNTQNDVWLRPHIAEFIGDSDCDYVLDPFAGQGDLLHAARRFNFLDYYGMDIDPDLCAEKGWAWNDSLEDIPASDNTLVITNPPYLAKNSAARNCLGSYDYFKGDNERYEDLYQIAIEKVLDSYQKAVFIIPETYFQTEFFKQHLEIYTVIEENPFHDTDCPVCVAAFFRSDDFFRIAGNNYRIYKNDSFLFNKFTLEDTLWEFNCNRYGSLSFNEPYGNLGLRAIDGTHPDNRIRFCKVADLGANIYDISDTSRSITIIDVKGVDISDEFITKANGLLEDLRNQTHDVVLSPFKNNNKAGQRRRRLDFKWARKIIEKTIWTLDK